MDIIHSQSQSSNEDLLCCRACLSTDCKLFHIYEYKLDETFSRISGTPISKDHLPQYLCTQCRTLLLKCMSFKDKCRRSEQLLKQELLKGELNMDCIRRIDRAHPLINLTLSGAHIIASAETPPTENIKKEPIDIVNVDEPPVDTAIKRELNMEIDEVDLGETTIGEVNLGETTIDEVKLGETTIDEVNLGETTIDEVNLGETTIDEVIFGETTIDEVNLGETTIDEVIFGDTTIDEVNLGVPNMNAIKLDAPNTDIAHIETVAIDSGKQKADSKRELVKKKDKVKIIGNIADVIENEFVVNKMKTIKTYKRHIATVKKEMDIEIQASNDKVNDELDKNETNIDAANMDKANINVSYKTINTAYANIISDDVGDSDIDDINEVKANMRIVEVESILRKAVKKTKTYQRKIGTTVKKNTENSDNVDASVSKPVKKRRRKKNRKNYRIPENDYLPDFDFSKFENDYDVKIVTLNKQEQLEEIAARKQSVNYTTSRFPCEECGKGFDMEPAYNNHRRRHSPSSGEHACEICLLRFKKPSQRHTHQDMHKLKFICVCGFVSRAKSTAKWHHEMHKGRTFVCQHCGKAFSKRSSCLSHVRLSHPTLNVVCAACGETFVSELGLKMHMSMTHPEIKKPQQFKCTLCSARFISLEALSRHTDSGDHAGCPCEQCGESCASEDALWAHVGERHPSESRRCEECRATFSSGAAFETHFRRKHLNERYTPAERAPRKQPAPLASRRAREPPRRQFVCEQCGYMAANAALLRYHQNGHLVIKPYPCPHCPKTFATNGARNGHARSHEGVKPYKCSVCSHASTMKANLNRHYQVVHLGVRENASCHVCARVFTTKSSLRLHINTVHNGQPWPKRQRRRKVKD